MGIKSLPEHERPKEKLIYQGAWSLSTAELIALVIRTGTYDKSAVQLAEDVLAFANSRIGALAGADVGELTSIDGIGTSKACSIIASMELAKRIAPEIGYLTRYKVSDSEAAAKLIMRELRNEKQEHVIAFLLNAKCEVESKVTISVGALTSSSITPREVFAPAVRRGAAAVILAHNHPSGDPTPSTEDIRVTSRLSESGKMLGISVYDHIIVGDGRYVSMLAEGYLV